MSTESEDTNLPPETATGKTDTKKKKKHKKAEKKKAKSKKKQAKKSKKKQAKETPSAATLEGWQDSAESCSVDSAPSCDTGSRESSYDVAASSMSSLGTGESGESSADHIGMLAAEEHIPNETQSSSIPTGSKTDKNILSEPSSEPAKPADDDATKLSEQIASNSILKKFFNKQSKPQPSTRKLRVLVCSANLGNERPDRKSIAAWIPNNGCYSEVARSPKYPLPPLEEQKELFQALGLPHMAIDPEKIDLDGIRDKDDHFDIIVIGLQEATFDVPSDETTFERESSMGSMKVKRLIRKSSIGTAASGSAASMSGESNVGTASAQVLDSLLTHRCPSYNMWVSFQRGEMMLKILTFKRLEVQTLSVKAQNTGIGAGGTKGIHLPNKGGIVAELLIAKSTRLSFCTTHLQAHEGHEKYMQRCGMTSLILEGTASPTDDRSNLSIDPSLKSHVSFFLGDLNFRTEIDEQLPQEDHHQQVMDLIEKQDWLSLNKADELLRALKRRDCLTSFSTLPCYFPPTFKVKRASGFQYKDQRRPSYTDRILFRTMYQMEDHVKPVVYEPIAAFTTSDHKPIRGAFEIQLNPKIKSRPPMGVRKAQLSSTVETLFANNKNGNSPYETTATMGGQLGSKLNLFLSDIQCTIKDRGNINAAPDPYVIFVTNPADLIVQQMSRWQKIKRRFRRGEKPVTADGFPRTKSRKATWTPYWDSFHLVAETHTDDGLPLDMTGSILTLVVMDNSVTTGEYNNKVIGMFPINLANLCSSTSIPAATPPPTSSSGTSTRRWSKLAQAVRWQSSSFRSSSFGAGGSGEAPNTPNATSDKRKLSIKQPLMKAGRQTGVIALTIDTKWKMWIADGGEFGGSQRSVRSGSQRSVRSGSQRSVVRNL